MPSRACGDDDAAQRAAVVYSLLATCKARGVDERAWLEDVLRRMPEYEPGKMLIPGDSRPPIPVILGHPC